MSTMKVNNVTESFTCEGKNHTVYFTETNILNISGPVYDKLMQAIKKDHHYEVLADGTTYLSCEIEDLINYPNITISLENGYEVKISPQDYIDRLNTRESVRTLKDDKGGKFL